MDLSDITNRPPRRKERIPVEPFMKADRQRIRDKVRSAQQVISEFQMYKPDGVRLEKTPRTNPNIYTYRIEVSHGKHRARRAMSSNKYILQDVIDKRDEMLAELKNRD